MNYDTLKALAKDERCKVTDLIALTPQNDPFYIGTESDKAWAQWFTDLWNRFGYGTGVHLRRVHYQIVSQEMPVTFPNGANYENTAKCWKDLLDAGKYARYLEMIDPEAFVDRRNPEPRIYMPAPSGVPFVTIYGELDAYDTELPDFPSLPSYALQGFTGEQRYHIEVWCEKSTQNDTLIPLCRQYGINLVTGVGEMSITATLSAVNREAARGKPMRIFYVSDFDPAGRSMPVAVARKIEYFLSKQQRTSDIRLDPVVLTPEQCATYRLPRTPLKDTELRAGAFEARFGSGATELDALEALHPGELRRILTQQIERYYDSGLNRRVREAAREVDEELERVQEEIYDLYADQIEELQAEYDGIRSDFESRMTSYGTKLADVWRAIRDDLDDAAIPDVDTVPEAEIADDNQDTPLYDSGRDYRTQLSFYKAFQGDGEAASMAIRDQRRAAAAERSRRFRARKKTT